MLAFTQIFYCTSYSLSASCIQWRLEIYDYTGLVYVAVITWSDVGQISNTEKYENYNIGYCFTMENVQIINTIFYQYCKRDIFPVIDHLERKLWALKVRKKWKGNKSLLSD